MRHSVLGSWWSCSFNRHIVIAVVIALGSLLSSYCAGSLPINQSIASWDWERDHFCGRNEPVLPQKQWLAVLQRPTGPDGHVPPLHHQRGWSGVISLWMSPTSPEVRCALAQLYETIENEVVTSEKLLLPWCAGGIAVGTTAGRLSHPSWAKGSLLR